MKTFHFLSGLPRSGSTVLSKLLNQHPDIFCTSTSPLLDYITPAAIQLHAIKNNHAYGSIVDVKRILTTTASSFFEFTDKPVIIDKSRGWPDNYLALKQDFTEEPKFIVTLRPIEEVIVSFHHILEKNGTPEIPEQIFSGWVSSFVDSLMKFSEHKEHVCVVTYEQLVDSPKETIERIEKYLGLDHHTYDIDDIKDNNPEDDSKWGVKDLHTIRSNLKRDNKPVEQVLSKTQLNYCKELTKQIYAAYGIAEQLNY